MLKPYVPLLIWHYARVKWHAKFVRPKKCNALLSRIRPHENWFFVHDHWMWLSFTELIITNLPLTLLLYPGIRLAISDKHRQAELSAPWWPNSLNKCRAKKSNHVYTFVWDGTQSTKTFRSSDVFFKRTSRYHHIFEYLYINNAFFLPCFWVFFFPLCLREIVMTIWWELLLYLSFMLKFYLDKYSCSQILNVYSF